MKFCDCEMQRKEDLIVFKCLLRCLKENGRLQCINVRSMKDLVDLCYVSRENHTETFADNITYWPSDCMLEFDNYMNIIYLSLLIVHGKINVYRRLTNRINKFFSDLHDLSCNGRTLENFLWSLDYVYKALIIGGVNENNANEIIHSIEKVIEGDKNKIPF